MNYMRGFIGFALSGSGDKYGESVSTKIRSFGRFKKVSARDLEFLNVTTPLAEI